MAKKLSSASGPAKVGTLLVSIALLGVTLAARAAEPLSPVQWDAKASEELATALHHMHEVWNTGDIKSLKNLIVGDDVLVTFELEPETHKPIRLTSKNELNGFVDAIVNDLDSQSAVSLLGNPKVHCRATKTLGVCTEECSIAVKKPGGIEERHSLWSTATAVRYDDGWKWIQWHMSVAAPVEIYRNGEKVASN